MNSSNDWYVLQSKENPDLFRVIFDFNQRPQHWVHPQTLQGLPHSSVVRYLIESTHGGRFLAAWLAKECRLDQAGCCWDFKEPRRRLALLGADSLERLACFSGAALVWPRIAAVIAKTEIQQLKQALGEEAHRFALRRAQLIVPQETALALEEGQMLHEQALGAGWNLLLDAMADDDLAVSQRIRLKLPPSAPALPTTNGERQALAWKRLRKIAPDVLTEGELKCFA